MFGAMVSSVPRGIVAVQARKRSVVMLTTDRVIDRRTIQQADVWEALGWKVTIVAMPLDSDVPEYDPRVKRVIVQGVHRHVVVWRMYRWLKRWVPGIAKLMRFFRGLIWRYVIDPERFYTHMFDATLEAYSPEVVWAVDLPMLPVGYKLSRRVEAQLIYDSHEWYAEQGFSKFEKRRWEKMEAYFIRACDCVMTVNASIADVLKQHHGLRNVAVIQNAVPLYTARKTDKRWHDIFKLPSEYKILLFQGGLLTGRHLEALVASMQFVQRSNIVIVILGDGPLHAKLQNICRSLALTKRVYFHPAVSQDVLLDYTQAADGGIIPYQATCLNSYYCTPNKLFEFIAAGVPVIASDFPEIRQIVKRYNLGLVGDLSTPIKLATQIERFFHCEEDSAKWRHNIAMNQERFSWENESKKLIEIIARVG